MRLLTQTTRVRRRLAYFALFAVAFVRVAMWFVNVSGDLSTCSTNAGVELEGVVQAAEFAEDIERQLVTVKVARGDCDELKGRKIRLAWYALEPRLVSGSRVQVVARLRRPWGSRNPGGFNYRLWLLGHNIRATGTLSELITIESSKPAKQVHSDLIHVGLLRAIALGEREGVAAQEWAVFRKTGTLHLMVVSGLHVGILAGLFVLVVKGASSLLPGFHRVLEYPYLGYVIALVAVAAFCVSTGFQGPVMRAGGMFVLSGLLYVSTRAPPWHGVLGLVLLVMVIAMPHLVLQVGFWLSFTAVAILLWTFSPEIRRFSWVAMAVRVQFALFVALTPLLSATVGASPLIAPFANLILVPLMSLLVIPCAMLGWMLEPLLGTGLLYVADFGMHLAWRVLTCLGAQSGGNIGYFTASVLMGLTIVGIGIALPWPRSIKFLLAALWGLLISRELEPPVWGHVRIWALDVGQGNASIVETAQHRLVVDAGPAYLSGFDAGENIVIPALRATGPDRLEMILVSHTDLDHAGGVASVAARYPDAQVVDRCKHKASWIWDGVYFQTLIHHSGDSSNERSCTLLVKTDEQVAFLPGDIGYQSELALKSQLPQAIDFLVAPHHGSNSSSHPAFVKWLAPEVVAISAGFQNRYGHPGRAVVSRYQRRGAMVINTADAGAVRWDSRTGQVTIYRRDLLGMQLPLAKDMMWLE
ncbi:MAG: DNA internalization-related competence protein ComEC/Rec2 [Pseudomonadota bacterium]|nr:DNA internalization-related competence protein ComEC/Rec2 [Pseudomonadota bacterium]